jgi:hypothetical protein
MQFTDHTYTTVFEAAVFIWFDYISSSGNQPLMFPTGTKGSKHWLFVPVHSADIIL